MASNKRISTRQKMINLMYLVFIAMLALRISTEVLDGFDLINDNIQNTITNTINRNNQLYGELDKSFTQNPEKAGKWHNLAQQVKHKSDSLYNYIQDLKKEVAVKTDGKDADINNLKTKDNIDAASEIFLAPNGGKGKTLKSAIDNYRSNISSLIADSDKKTIIEAGLSTEPSDRAIKQNKDWLHASFENMPSVAVITYLSELQSNVKQAEGEALNTLLRNIDLSDFRVNALTAYVIPESKTVIRGTNYNADIIVAAVDTTQRPKIVVNGKEVKNGELRIPAGSTGTFPLSGYIEMTGRDGQSYKREFNDSYNVIEPLAIVESKLMDVVYAGIDNNMVISVPGFTANEIIASASQGGTIVKNGNLWTAKPSNIGGKFIVNVSVKTPTGHRSMAQKEFRVRRLPDPSAYIPYADANGTTKTFKQGRISRNALLNANGIKAAIDDGVLDIPFTVIGFRTFVIDAMGNAMQEMSSGANFSSRQLEQIKRIERGTLFLISGIRVKGPDGVEREIAPMEIRLN